MCLIIIGRHKRAPRMRKINIVKAVFRLVGGLRAFHLVSTTPGIFSSRRKKPVVGFPGSSSIMEGILTEVVRSGLVICRRACVFVASDFISRYDTLAKNLQVSLRQLASAEGPSDHFGERHQSLQG